MLDDKSIDEHMAKLARIGRLNVDPGALRWTPLLTTRQSEEDEDDSDPNRTPDPSAAPSTPADRRGGGGASRGGRKKRNVAETVPVPNEEKSDVKSETPGSTAGKRVSKGSVKEPQSGGSELPVTPPVKRGPGRPPKSAKVARASSAVEQKRRSLPSRHIPEDQPVSCQVVCSFLYKRMIAW